MKSMNMRTCLPLGLFGCLLLIGCGTNDINRLRSDLQSTEGDARYTAVKQIEDQIEQGADASVAVPELAAALADADPKVRYRAAKSLAKLEQAAAPAVMQLSEALVDPDNEDRIRYYVAKSIYKLGDERVQAKSQLVRALKDSNPDVVRYVAKSLGKIGKPAHDAIGILKRLSKSPDPDLSAAASDAVKRIAASSSS